MKNILLLIAVFFFGCGKDGKDGSAYLAIDWSSAVTSYSDNNPGTPSAVWRNTSYRSEPGTYSCSWYAETSTSSVLWRANYTITINKGEKGEFLTNGKDGSQKNFNLYLHSSGFSFGKKNGERDSKLPLPSLDNKKIESRQSEKTTINKIFLPDTLFNNGSMMIMQIIDKQEP